MARVAAAPIWEDAHAHWNCKRQPTKCLAWFLKNIVRSERSYLTFHFFSSWDERYTDHYYLWRRPVSQREIRELKSVFPSFNLRRRRRDGMMLKKSSRNEKIDRFIFSRGSWMACCLSGQLILQRHLQRKSGHLDKIWDKLRNQKAGQSQRSFWVRVTFGPHSGPPIVLLQKDRDLIKYGPDVACNPYTRPDISQFFETQNPPTCVSEQHKNRRSKDFWASKLWNVQIDTYSSFPLPRVHIKASWYLLIVFLSVPCVPESRFLVLQDKISFGNAVSKYLCTRVIKGP